MRRLSRPLLVALLAIVAFFYPLLAPTPHRIDQAHFELIESGMTRAEVEAIFGVPPGQFDWAEPEPMHARQVWFLMAMRLAESDHTATTSVGHDGRLIYAEAISESWASRNGVFTVRFGGDGEILSTSGPHEVRIVPPWQRWWQAFRQP